MEDVQAIYQVLLKKGYTAKDAAKEAQARTGVSIVTRKPIKGPQNKPKSKWVFGEYE